ncbi:YjbQ family protein [Candidatus Parcubacteria bacterium]|nr:YjbQ family protein [Candidatus Parcubacteria bacterium]
MRFTLSTKGFCDIIDITSRVQEAVKKSGIRDGFCIVSCPGSTIGITTIENEPELLKDFKELLEKLIPSNKEYHHDKVWGEANGFSHLRSALIKPFLIVPIENGKLVLGTWQQIVFVDFDSREREREIFVKVFGKRS